MYLLYLDEFGHPGPYDPTNARHCQHPLFGFAGFVIPGQGVRDFDRRFLRLKGSFYKNEIQRASTLKGVRPERFEPKALRSKRDRRFTVATIKLVALCRGYVFAHGCVKNWSVARHSYRALYHGQMYGALRRYEKYLRDCGGRFAGQGIVIMDRREEAQNERVLEAAQACLYSDPDFKKPDVRLVETPLLVPSDWYHGVQAAHVIGQAVARCYWHRRMNNALLKKDHDELYPALAADSMVYRQAYTAGTPFRARIE